MFGVTDEEEGSGEAQRPRSAARYTGRSQCLSGSISEGRGGGARDPVRAAHWPRWLALDVRHDPDRSREGARRHAGAHFRHPVRQDQSVQPGSPRASRGARGAAADIEAGKLADAAEIFPLTRSSAILDLAAVGPEETIELKVSLPCVRKSRCDPPVVHDVVRLPRLAAVRRERLFPLHRGGGERREHAAHFDRPTFERVV